MNSSRHHLSHQRPRAGALDFERLAVELLRALRGRRSQSGLSRRLGYRSNIVHRWEHATCAPTAARFLAACALLKLDVAGSYSRFFARKPDWLEPAAACSPATVAAFLRELRGRTPIVELARAAGVSRYTASRWLSGRAQPKLPEFLRLIEASSRRLVDYLATLVDVRELPSIAARAARLAAAREAAFGEPWSHAVLRALEVRHGARGKAARGLAELGAALGIDAATLQRAILVLRRSGQVRSSRGHLLPTKALVVDTRTDAARSSQLKARWAQVATERLARRQPGLYGYSLFAVSRSDLRRIRALQLEFVRAMQSIIAASTQPECVGLYSSSLLDLDPGPSNALGATA